ncbi:hypothetical protein GCM10009087_19070 [Sphingomonas oligophenolica]
MKLVRENCEAAGMADLLIAEKDRPPGAGGQAEYWCGDGVTGGGSERLFEKLAGLALKFEAAVLMGL